MPFSREIAGKSGARQGARDEKKEIPPRPSTDHTILCSQDNRGPELHHDPQNRCNGERKEHNGPADDTCHI